ncbi:hypothetical protein QTP88_006310 [Uroleucon formosanum]
MCPEHYFSGTIGGYDSVNQELKDVIVVHPALQHANRRFGLPDQHKVRFIIVLYTQPTLEFVIKIYLQEQ